MTAAEVGRIREWAEREAERASLLAVLAKRSPFDRLEREHLEWMIERLRPATHAAGTVLVGEAVEPDRLHVIRSGTARVETADAPPQVLAELREGDCFPLEALHGRRATHTRLRAGTEVRCLELAAEDFRALLDRGSGFRAFCERRSRAFLDRLQALHRAQHLSTDSVLLPATGAEGLVREMGAAIRHAQDVPALALAAQGVRGLVRAALAEGAPAARLTAMVSSMNGRVAARAIDLEMRSSSLAGLDLCWVALGSEGRLEQTLCTDQDNGIVFADGGRDPAETRALLLPVAQRANAALAACGFPLCKGGVMAGNPEWCLSVEEWRARFALWLREPQPEALLGAAICFDLRPVYGNRSLAAGLREWLAEAAPRSRRFLGQLTRIAAQRRAPLGIVRDFAVDGGGDAPGTIDLKGSGTALFVESARILGLATGSTAATTELRLREGGQRLGVASGDATAWIEAFHFVQALRLRRQADLDGTCPPDHNRLDPYALNRLDRRFLREALREAAGLQKLVARAWGAQAAGA